MARRRSKNRRAELGCPWGAWTGGAARSSGPEAPIFDADDEAGQEDAGAAASWILLGTRLRDLRESAGISRDDAAYAIRGSASKISRLEMGRVRCKLRD
ncbi:MAG TPA: helix-turn-helix transcriptional regulator, partial [Streptosporangiaceae bacterium]